MISEIGLFAKDKQSAPGCMGCEPGAGSWAVLIIGLAFALANKHLVFISVCRAVILPSGKFLVDVCRDLAVGEE